MNNNFHYLKLTGETSSQIGFSHGEKLRKEIHENIDFYLGIFGVDSKEVEGMANQFRNKIKDFDIKLYEEIVGIAEGAEIPEWQAFMLNSRSEILSNIKTVSVNECSLVFFPDKATLFENWDWAKEPGRNTFVLDMQQKDHPRIFTLTEAGIVAKIGFNNLGIGVGLNFLDPVCKLEGVPVHLLLRKVLESTTIEEAEQVIQMHGTGVSGNICIVSEDGNFSNFEIDGRNIFNQKVTGKKYFCHTNHFLGKENGDDVDNSKSRYKQIEEKVSKEDFENILFDNTNEVNPILQHYIPDPFIGNYGTNASIKILLKDKEMNVRYGFEDYKNNYIYKM